MLATNKSEKQRQQKKLNAKKNNDIHQIKSKNNSKTQKNNKTNNNKTKQKCRRNQITASTAIKLPQKNFICK